MLQKEWSRSVQERMPRQLGASDKTHKTKIRKSFHDRIDTHSANLLHLRFRDRLAVGDNRKGLK